MTRPLSAVRQRPAVHRMVARPVGLVLVVLAGTLVATAILESAFGLASFEAAQAFQATLPLVAAVPIALLLGGAALWWARPVPTDLSLDRREASVAVVAIWALLGLVGALPLVFGAGTSLPDAIFEAVSGFTTTGATIYGDIEGTLSPPLVMWRAVMHWLGGMGVVVLFVAIFPNIGVSGKHLFKSEVPGVTAEGLRPRITDTSLVLWRLYLGLTLVAALLLWRLGMGTHDAIVHALGTLSTGGFSSRDASIAAFSSPPIEWALSVLMLIAGVNFGLFYGVVRTRKLSVLWRSTELRLYVGIIAACTAVLTVTLLPLHGGSLSTSLRVSFFRVATSLTSTGFGIDDHAEYPPVAMGITLLMMLVGGCAGSTAGGIKVARLLILAKAAVAQIRRTIRPAVVQVVRVDRRPVPKPIVLEVTSFLFVYMACLAVGSLVVMATDGAPAPTAIGAVMSCLSNMGPTPFYQAADNFAAWSPTAKLVFSATMVLGRLEFFTVLAILLPEVWRR